MVKRRGALPHAKQAVYGEYRLVSPVATDRTAKFRVVGLHAFRGSVLPACGAEKSADIAMGSARDQNDKIG